MSSVSTVVEWPNDPPRPLDGYCTGSRFNVPPTGRLWMRLVLGFRDGGVAGSGDDAVGAFHVFGIFSPTSGQAALLLTYVSGAVLTLDVTIDGSWMHGCWHGNDDQQGFFHAQPLELARGVSPRDR